MRPLWLTLALLPAITMIAVGAADDNPWPHLREPAPGPARAIGDYSAGCLQGAVALPLGGVGYHVMRPSRARNYGHPTLVAYVQQLGRRVRARSLHALLVGDLSQPRGGRAAGGHASHQTGLDVDLWYTLPGRARAGALSTALREQLAAESVVDVASASLRKDARTRVTALLRLAVDDPRVDRIFVHPAIKRSLCANRKSQRAWLRKVRPWYGHDEHFHVRLACPADAPDCRPQPPLPDDDGCDKLDWWFNRAAQAARQEARKAYRETISEGSGWPAACDALLAQPAPSGP